MGKNRLLGAHMSIAGGVHKVFERAKAVGCTALQLFTRNNLQWKAPPLSLEICSLYLAEQKRLKIAPAVAHANYLINPASPDRLLWEKSIEGLKEEIRRALALKIPYIVLHPGNHMGAGEQEGEGHVAEALDSALEAFPEWPGKVLIETTAGGGTTLGSTFEGLARLYGKVKFPARAGFCMDTSHIFAAGYDIRTPEAYRETMARFDGLVGLGHLHVIHVNDSKSRHGSHVDRHEHIGKGLLGSQAFVNLLNDGRLAHLPFLLETPKGKDSRGVDLDMINLRALRRLIW
jgi:deoxyribonuclease IV